MEMEIVLRPCVMMYKLHFALLLSLLVLLLATLAASSSITMQMFPTYTCFKILSQLVPVSFFHECQSSGGTAFGFLDVWAPYEPLVKFDTKEGG